MSNVTQRVMSIGAWNLDLKDLSRTAYAALDPTTKHHGLVVITPAPMDPNLFTGAQIIANALYTGIYLDYDDHAQNDDIFPSDVTLSGIGLAGWIGDSQMNGNFSGAALLSSASRTFAQFIAALHPPSLTLGTVNTITSPTASLTKGFGATSVVTRREAIEFILGYFSDAEWRCNPDLTVDYGTPAQLYGATASAFLTRLGGGHDLFYKGVHSLSSRGTIKMSDWVSSVVTTAGTTVSGPAVTQLDPLGNPVVWAMLMTAGQSAQGLLTERQNVQAQFVYQTDEWSLLEQMQVGANVGIFDPATSTYDLNNPVVFGGGVIYPLLMRLMGATWPIRDTMGVYFRAPDAAGTITDLTPFVAWENDAAATLEIGKIPDPPPPSFSDLRGASWVRG